MTKQEVLEALERLRDLLNENGKRELDSIKAGISMNLLDRDEAIVSSAPVEPEPEPEEPEEEPEEKPEAKPFVSGGRFAEKKSVVHKPVAHKVVPHGTKKKK